MIKKISILNTVLIVGIIVFILFNFIQNSSKVKQVYVINGELHKNFDYQKELNEEYLEYKKHKDLEIEKMISTFKEKEDLLKGKENTDSEVNDYRISYDRIQNIQKKIDEELVNLNNEYNLKIWDKLNSYTKEFGRENNFSIIFGTSGGGNIMYAEDTLDVTKELIEYCNRKYNGK